MTINSYIHKPRTDLKRTKKNAWLNSYASNTERRSHAQERLKHLDMLIAEQETLEKL